MEGQPVQVPRSPRSADFAGPLVGRQPRMSSRVGKVRPRAAGSAATELPGPRPARQPRGNPRTAGNPAPAGPPSNRRAPSSPHAKTPSQFDRNGIRQCGCSGSPPNSPIGQIPSPRTGDAPALANPGCPHRLGTLTPTRSSGRGSVTDHLTSIRNASTGARQVRWSGRSRPGSRRSGGAGTGSSSACA